MSIAHNQNTSYCLEAYKLKKMEVSLEVGVGVGVKVEVERSTKIINNFLPEKFPTPTSTSTSTSTTTSANQLLVKKADTNLLEQSVWTTWDRNKHPTKEF